MHPTRIIIIGGGFAGVKCARTLRQRLPQQACEIVLFSQENNMVFYPLLAEVAGAAINPGAVTVPLRQMLPRVQCRTEEVRQIDLAASEGENHPVIHPCLYRSSLCIVAHRHRVPVSLARYTEVVRTSRNAAPSSSFIAYLAGSMELIGGALVMIGPYAGWATFL
ncbi:MAG: FAD-dependent oxidoreductase [Nitrospiraceae bacterium]